MKIIALCNPEHQLRILDRSWEGKSLQFEYRVKDGKGKTYTGIVETGDKISVIERLANQNLYILSLKEVKKARYHINIEFNLRVKVRDLIIMTRQLAAMLSAGLPILRCLKILEEQTSNKTLKKAVWQIIDDIETGLALWQAAAKHPKIFSPIYVNMLKAGEAGGILEPVLARLSSHLEREHSINSRIKSVSIYPIIIMISALAVVVFILAFIMPTFASMFQSAGAELPLFTLMLFNIGTALKTRWLPIVIFFILLIFFLKLWKKTPGGKMFFDRLYLQIPVIGQTVSQIAVARFTRTLGILLKSGIPILQALQVSEEVVGNAVITKGIREARTSISEGASITGPLKETGVFEPMITQMIAVGEETGTLDDMLILMADYYENESMYAIDTMMSLAEPLLILLVGLIVGGLIIAMLLPLFKMMSIVGL